MIFVGLSQLKIFRDSQKSGFSLTTSMELGRGDCSCGSFLTPLHISAAFLKVKNTRSAVLFKVPL